MDEEILETEQPEEGYKPRPKWQVFGAWIALILFLLMLVLYYINIFRGGA